MKFKVKLLILGSLLMTGCDNNSGNNQNKNQGHTMSTPFYIKVGVSPADYNQRNQLHTKKNIDKQPAGLNFYEQDWNSKNTGNVKLDHADYSFIVPYVLGVSGVEDTKYPERGLYKFSVQSGITPDEFIDHDQARIQLMKILQDIVALGWQPYIEFYSQPRLLGQQSFQHAIQKAGYAPDPLYLPTLDEWMAFDSGNSWVFHADNVFLEIGFRRNSQYMEKDGAGVYLLTYTLLTRDARARNYFQGKEREQWQDLWVEGIKKDKVMRYQNEVELIKQGYHINTQYVEPKIHPDDPVEPEGEAVEALLDFIQKNNN